MTMRVVVCILLSLAVSTEAAKVTPMEKVIKLLKDLSSKVTAEGAKEAAEYDKYACFCKEQADEKLYSIEKSDNKIADLKAEIDQLDSEITQLNSDISTLAKKISATQSEIDRKQKKRDKERAEYDKAAKDMNEAIDAAQAAIDALRASKSAMKGAKTTNLVQVDDFVKAAAKVQGAPKFQYQSNDIIATIEDLMATFKSMKKNLDVEEHDTNAAFEKARLALRNTMSFAEKDRDEKSAIAEGKTEAKNEASSHKDDETNDRDADQNFLDELTSDCESKALLFDQRSKARGDELTALSKATTELQDGAVPNFGSNKKLVGLQKVAKVVKAAIKPVAFVQIDSVQHHKQADRDAMIQRVQSFLAGAADRTGSRTLSSISARVAAAADHFVKVRGLIKDLIAKLKSDAKAEATQKRFCDTSMKKAISSRDEASSQIEVANAKITTNTAKKNSLEDEISTLEGEIAELKKALLEATELRATEKAEYTEGATMSQEGADSVKLALSILKGFYDNAFAQTGKYTPPNAGRDGKTVGDMAPAVFGSEYSGAQSESKGIVGILEVILSDFQRTHKQANTDNADSKAAFEKFEKESNADMGKKQKRIKNANGELSAANAEILAQQGALSDAKDQHEDSLETLEDLEAMCVKGEETWEERKKKREEEVEALKEALEIFENWQD
jgi:uncharacterized coiled-coil DUF342 family protein